MTPSPPSPSNPVPEEPLAEAGRQPLHAAIESARHERRGGISVGTLAVASAASAAAAFTASHLWGSGTVLSAALTPVVVTLVSEFLRRPVDRVSATVAPIIPRPAASAGSLTPQEPPGPATAVEATDWAPVSWGDSPRAGWRPRWRLVLVTGLLAFAIVVAFYTVPDLLVGHSITGAGGPTTLFSSGGGHAAPATTTPATPTTAAPTQTVTVQVQTTTVTVPATSTAGTVPTATAPTDTTTTATTPPTTTTTPAP